MSIALSSSLLEKVLHIAEQAGEKISDIYHQKAAVEITTKEGGSPLTEADMAAHHLICNSLKQLTPDTPLLSEESQNLGYGLRENWQQYWLIDPLDGTKEFINRTNEFTVNIALIDKGKPILGVVVAPELGLSYYAMQGSGAYKNENGKVEPIQCGKPQMPVRIIASRRHGGEALQRFLDRYENHELVNAGSSLKICYVAENKADFYPRLGLTSEWDTAAAHCILNCAGGSMLQMDEAANTSDKELIYNKENILNPFFLASGL